MIVIINTRTKQAYYMKCYNVAGKLVGITGDTLRRWHLNKLAYKQDPIERFNHFNIYFDAIHLKSEKGKHLRKG